MAKSTKRSRAAKKAARTRAAKKAARSRAAKKGARSRRTRRSRPARSRKHRATRSRSRSSGRSRGRRRSYRSQGRHRPVVYRKGRKWYAGKPHPKRGRRRSHFKGIRLNPPLALPTFGSVKSILTEGGYGLLGWVGVNAVMLGADKVGLGKLKEGRDPKVIALINAAVRLLSIPLVAWGAGKVLGPRARQVAAIGGAFNLVFHAVQDVAAQSGMLPSWGAPLLLGYDGVSDFVQYPGMRDYVQSYPPAPGTGGTPYSGAFAPSRDMLA